MGNIIELREKLTFGRFKGKTGLELLKSGEGTNYLKWVYENTDIQMDMFVVNALVDAKLVKRNMERRNSKAGGGVLKTDGVTHSLNPKAHIVAGGRLSELLHVTGATTLNDLKSRSVEVQLPFKTIAKGLEETAKLRQMLLSDKVPSVEEMFHRAMRKQIRSLNRDTEF